MAPKMKVTRDMIVDAAVEVIRQEGFENLNVRTTAAQLGCSTQPVMYHFETVDSLKRAAYARADRIHTEYLMDTAPDCDPILGIGLNYIRFAVEEPRLFRFLFQSGYAGENDLQAMIRSEELEPVLAAMQAGLGMDMEKTRDVFLVVALFAHGYASIIANNGLKYDEALIAEHLEMAWNGAVSSITKEERQ